MKSKEQYKGTNKPETDLEIQRRQTDGCQKGGGIGGLGKKGEGTEKCRLAVNYKIVMKM